MKLTAIIIDDELPTLNLMKYIIQKSGKVDVIGEFSNPKEVISNIDKLKPDIAFVDVEMPGMNGIALAEELGKLDYKIQIIFSTAYKEYAFDAFKVEAVDYILKPVTEDQINKTIDKIIKRYPLILSKNREGNEDSLNSNITSEVHSDEEVNANNLNKSYKNEDAKNESTKNKNKKNENEVLIYDDSRSNKNQRCNISCLGQFAVYMEYKDTISSNQVKFETVKVEELFAYLTLSEGRPVEKWRLCEMLWPDFPDKKAEHNLHSTIYRLKTSFKKVGFTEDFINYKNGCYTLNVDNFYCDLWDFRKLENYKDLEAANVILIEKVLDLYQGELYGNKAYIWSIDEGQKLNDLNVHMTMKLSNYYIEKKQYDISIRHLYKLLRLNNYNEEVYELMMKCYFYKGDKVKLMKFYKDVRDTLAKELDVKPSKTTVELYNYLIRNLEQ
ncbi:response regulator [Clostridium sp. YIM B02505]|uniref:Stage 0 sporulation protein A homolog n=1 Tax=Clostridium yunnanense TaxID=2800325 RepID=A0ABS1EUI0_9CLOT|nr:response regulator [Clostridium yunnanense]MBK1813039.1 response regulator [Clostridium yunnanense]